MFASHYYSEVYHFFIPHLLKKKIDEKKIDRKKNDGKKSFFDKNFTKSRVRQNFKAVFGLRKRALDRIPRHSRTALQEECLYM